jgi:hypothetical protein
MMIYLCNIYVIFLIVIQYIRCSVYTRYSRYICILDYYIKKMK